MKPIIKGYAPQKKIQLPNLSYGVNEIIRVVSELNALKRDLETNIRESKSLRDKNEELNRENEAIQKELYSRISEASKALLQAKQIQKGDRGEQGEQGLDADEQRIIEEIFAKIRQPENGKDAIVDYDKIIAETVAFFPDEKTLIKKILAKIPKPKDGLNAEFDSELFIGQILERLEAKKPEIKDIVGLQDALNNLRQVKSYIHGGGDTVSAGSNITIAVVNGIKVINASAGGGTSILETPTGTINGSNTSFTITQTPLANSLMLFFNGQLLKENTDFTLSGTTITFTVAPTNQFNNATLQAFYRY